VGRRDRQKCHERQQMFRRLPQEERGAQNFVAASPFPEDFDRPQYASPIPCTIDIVTCIGPIHVFLCVRRRSLAPLIDQISRDTVYFASIHMVVSST
jgi:hypothetical protein